MPTLPEIWHDAIHADSILIPVVPRHVRPIPLKRHWHFPQILGHIVEGLVELAHGHGAEVVDAIDFDTRRVGEPALLLLQHRGGHPGGAVLRHVCVGLQGGVREVGREGEGLVELAGANRRGRTTYFVEAVEVGVEDHAGGGVVLRSGGGSGGGRRGVRVPVC
jgi:hypothetical protein